MVENALCSEGGRRPNWREYIYESGTPDRDAFWLQAVRDAGIEVYEQLTISPPAYDYILSDIRNITSRRRTTATEFLSSDR